MNSDAAISRGTEQVRALLDEHGFILQHDVSLPSVTTTVAGEPVKGSWWGHPKGKLIWNVLVALEDEVAWAKLVRKKVCLVHRRLWPALAAVGAARSPWQLKGLTADAALVLKEVEQAGPIRSDHLKWRGSKKASAVVGELAVRLLVNAVDVHTEAGRHEKELRTYEQFAAHHKLGALPRESDAREEFVATVCKWVGPARGPKLLFGG